jgi:hypothetical protein
LALTNRVGLPIVSPDAKASLTLVSCLIHASTSPDLI